MADNVLAAFFSAFFSTGFFFFLAGFDLIGKMHLVLASSCLEITFGFSGILTSAILDGRRFIGRAVDVTNSDRLLVNAAGAVFENCSGIIFMVGPSTPAPSESAAGNLINIVYICEISSSFISQSEQNFTDHDVLRKKEAGKAR